VGGGIYLCNAVGVARARTTGGSLQARAAPNKRLLGITN